MYFWVNQMPANDEMSLHHTIFCGYPDISGPFLSILSQMRQPSFIRHIGTDFPGNSRQHYPAGPFIEGLFETSA
jgi:hypothetical protein